MRRRSESGQALIEGAISIVVLLSFLLGAMDMGRAAYTYNALSNLSREASHYALNEYLSDSNSPCYYASFDNSNCLEAVKSYVLGLHMAPGLSSSNVSASVTIECGDGTTCSPGIPMSVAMSSHFQPFTTALLGIGPFNISSSSTTQFVIPPTSPTPSSATATPGPPATPAPTPTVVPEGPPSNASASPTEGCTQSCENFTLTWTPPNNVSALGHYDISFGSSGNYIYADPVPAELGGTPVTSTTVDVGSSVGRDCFHIIAVFTDGSAWTTTTSWKGVGNSDPNC